MSNSDHTSEEQAYRELVAGTAEKLYALGYRVIPIKGKDPYEMGWQTKSYPPCVLHVRALNCDNMGVVFGQDVGQERILCAFDADIEDEQLAEAVWRALGVDAPIRFGRRPKWLLPIILSHAEGFNQDWIYYKDDARVGIQILGRGQKAPSGPKQAAFFGIHPGVGRPYFWEKDSRGRGLLDMAPTDWPCISDLATLKARVDAVMAHHGWIPRAARAKQMHEAATYAGPISGRQIAADKALFEREVAEMANMGSGEGRGTKAHLLGLRIGMIVRAGHIDLDWAIDRLRDAMPDNSNALREFERGVMASTGERQRAIHERQDTKWAKEAQAQGIEIEQGQPKQSFDDRQKEQQGQSDKGGPASSGWDIPIPDFVRAVAEIRRALGDKASALVPASPEKMRRRVLNLIEAHTAQQHIAPADFAMFRSQAMLQLNLAEGQFQPSEYELSIADGVCRLIALKHLDFNAADSEARQIARLHADREPSPHHYSWGSYTMSFKDGLMVQTERGVGTAKEVVVVPVSGSFEILGSSRDARGEGWGRWLRWNDGDGRTHTQLIDSALIHGDAKALCTKLSAGGLTINAGAQDMFKRYLGGMFEVAGRVTVAHRTGWFELAHGGRAFVLPDAVIKPDGAEEIVLDAAAHAPYSQRGTLEDWKKGVGAYAAGHLACVLFVSIGFAGPLLEMADMDGAAIHGYDGTTIGKTTLGAMSASVWGKGAVIGGLIRPWRATSNGLEGAAAGSTGTVLYLDEIGQLESKEAYGVIYMLASGSGKTRANRDGSLRDPATWCNLTVSTGEMPFAQKLAEDRARKSKGGQAIRMLDLPVDRGLSFGVFDSAGGFDEPGQLADACKAAAVTSYGTAGPAFVQALMDRGIDGAEVRRRVGDWLKTNAEGKKGEVKRAGKIFALVAVAGELAIELGVAPWGKGRPTDAAVWAYKAWLGQRGGEGPADEMTAVSHIRQIIEMYGGPRFKEIANKPRGFSAPPQEFVDLPNGRTPPIMYGYRKGVGPECEWYVPEETWNSVFCEGQNPHIVVKALHSRGMLRTDSDGRHTKVKVRLGGDGTQRFYAITAKILDDE